MNIKTRLRNRKFRSFCDYLKDVHKDTDSNLDGVDDIVDSDNDDSNYKMVGHDDKIDGNNDHYLVDKQGDHHYIYHIQAYNPFFNFI